MIDMGAYRVRLRASVRGLGPEAMGDWSFRSLDVLLDDPTIVEADVAATLAAGDVEFDLHVVADDVPAAVRLGAEAVRRATASAAGVHSPEIQHAEVDLLPATA